MELFKILTGTSIFKGLTEQQIRDLFGNAVYYLRTFDPGEIVAQSEDSCDNLIIVIEGSVKGDMVDYSGKVIKIEDREASQTVAAAFLFGKNNKFPVNVESTDFSTLLFIPRKEFLKMLQASEIVLKNYLDSVSNRSQFLSSKIRFLSFKTIKGKIAQYILNLSVEDKDRITILHTQQDLAELFGVTRPSLARALGEFVEEGILQIDRKEVIILDRARLKELVR